MPRRNMMGPPRRLMRKSKTGLSECSQAMSMWVKARRAGSAVGAQVFQILGKCRSIAYQRSHANALERSGQDLKAQAVRSRIAKQGTTGYITKADRAARAKALRAQRAANPRTAKQQSHPLLTKGSPERKDAAERLRMIRDGRLKYAAEAAGGVVNKYGSGSVKAGTGIAIKRKDGPGWNVLSQQNAAKLRRTELRNQIRDLRGDKKTPGKPIAGVPNASEMRRRKRASEGYGLGGKSVSEDVRQAADEARRLKSGVNKKASEWRKTGTPSEVVDKLRKAEQEFAHRLENLKRDGAARRFTSDLERKLRLTRRGRLEAEANTRAAKPTKAPGRGTPERMAEAKAAREARAQPLFSVRAVNKYEKTLGAHSGAAKRHLENLRTKFREHNKRSKQTANVANPKATKTSQAEYEGAAGDAARAARVKPTPTPTPTIRQQAAAHRASKGTLLERVNRLEDKAKRASKKGAIAWGRAMVTSDAAQKTDVSSSEWSAASRHRQILDTRLSPINKAKWRLEALAKETPGSRKAKQLENQLRKLVPKKLLGRGAKVRRTETSGKAANLFKELRGKRAASSKTSQAEYEGAAGDAAKASIRHLVSKHGLAKVPNLVDEMTARVPGLTRMKARALIEKWQKEDKLSVGSVNDTRLESRITEGLKSTGKYPTTRLYVNPTSIKDLPTGKAPAPPKTAGGKPGANLEQRRLIGRSRTAVMEGFNLARRGRYTPKQKPTPKAEAKAKKDTFSLSTHHKAKVGENQGRGVTKAMFDMKKGDLKGQTSIFDKLESKGELTSTQKAKMSAAVRAVEKSTGRKSVSIPHAMAHARQQASKARQAGNITEAHRWSEHADALGHLNINIRYKKRGGWNKAPESERGKAASVVANARAGKASNQSSAASLRVAPKTTEKPELLHRVSEKQALKARRTKTAAAIRKQRQASRETAAPEKFGKSGKTYEFKTGSIHFDPERFQYKLAAQGAHGTTEALKDVKHWNPELAGVVSVWKDPKNGKTYVVNGHHRLDLAKKLGVKNISARYLDAKTPEEARAKGALVNIAEGRGSAIDAAKFFRNPVQGQGPITPELLKSKGVSLKEHTASQGLALSGLPERAFKQVVNGDLSVNRASIIGGSGLSHAHQEALLKELGKPKNKSLTDGTVRRMVERAKSTTSVKQKTHDLFGSTEEEKSLFVHRAKLEDSISRSLAADSRLFKLVSKSKAAEALAERGKSHIDTTTTGKVGKESAAVHGVFEQLAARHPSITKPLNQAAERLHNGEPYKTVESETRRKVREAVKRILEDPKAAFE